MGLAPLPDGAWDAWTPWALAARLSDLAAPWYVAGGWALDLAAGRQTRAHSDLEFVVLSADTATFRIALTELEFFQARDGSLTHLPRNAAPPADATQLWGADMPAGRWRVDMMIERGTPDTWVYKRDPAIRAPRRDVVLNTGDGLPYLAPSAVLLFKAKHRRDKDERDFAAFLPHLDATERTRLRTWLKSAHPGHVWLDRL